MLLDYLSKLQSDLAPTSGRSLIASPFLKDPYFLRSVVFLCKHSVEGSFGFVLNKPYDDPLNKLIPDTFNKEIKVFLGGPVQPDTVHFLHQYPELISGGEEIQKGIFWGGNFEEAVALINAGQLDLKKIKFFVGYAGWGAGQLKGELNEESWIVSESRKALLFDKGKKDNIWSEYLKRMGKAFEMYTNFPIDPSLN